jgi:hypothetical protein
MKKRRKGPKERDYRSITKKIKPVKKYKPECNICLYGKSGTGKTTFACTFPRPILLLDINERGTDSVRDQKGIDVIRVDDWDDLQSVYWLLKKGDHKYETAIWDTVSQVQDLAIKDVMGESNKQAGDWGSMSRKGWGNVSAKLKNEISDWVKLDLNMVFIAHNRIFNLDDEYDESEGQIDPSVGPRLMPSVSDSLCAEVGVVGNMFIREKVRKVAGKVKKKKQFCLRVGPHAYYTTKIRKPKKIEVPEFIVNPSFEDLQNFWVRKGK